MYILFGILFLISKDFCDSIKIIFNRDLKLFKISNAHFKFLTMKSHSKKMKI